MRWWRALLVTSAVAVLCAIAWFALLRTPKSAVRPRPVPSGDHEIAWLHNPTAFETWENFVWGAKRAEMAGDGPGGLEIDDTAAYPDRTTAVPEVVIRRQGFDGALRVRWYKVTDDATQEAWVTALAKRNPSPLAILAGWSSDRAKSLADAMRDAVWSGPKPLYLLATATADKVDEEGDVARGGDQGPNLISVYDRSFRFCFTNRQMANSVTDFVLSDPTLRPGPIAWPGLSAVPAFAAGAWAGVAALAVDAFPAQEPIPGYAIEWQDDPYSIDLCSKFRNALSSRGSQTGVRGVPRLSIVRSAVPFSVGRLNRANAFEAQAAEYILANLPPPGTRSILVIPTVSAPARRTLRALVQRNPNVGRQIVAVTGDGLGMNTFFRDREFAWPNRSLPIPFVMFTHANPFGWDTPGTTAPPGYELTPPKPGTVRSSTEATLLFTRLTQVLATACFPDGATAIAETPDTVAAYLRSPALGFFEPTGDRRDGTGEHIVVLRPNFLGSTPDPPDGKPQPDATLEVYARPKGNAAWALVHSIPLGRATGGHSE